MMPAEWDTVTPSGWLTLDPMLLTLPKEGFDDVILNDDFSRNGGSGFS